jgi:hypothetical protein
VTRTRELRHRNLEMARPKRCELAVSAEEEPDLRHSEMRVNRSL